MLYREESGENLTSVYQKADKKEPDLWRGKTNVEEAKGKYCFFNRKNKSLRGWSSMESREVWNFHSWKFLIVL